MAYFLKPCHYVQKTLLLILTTCCCTQKMNFLALKSNGQRTNHKSAKTNNCPNRQKKRRRETPRDSYKHPQKERQRRFQQENAGNVKEKIRKSKESISKMKAHSHKGNCPETFIGRILPPIKISNPTLPLSERTLSKNILGGWQICILYITLFFLSPYWISREFLFAVIVVPSTFSAVLLDGIIYTQPKKGSVA